MDRRGFLKAGVLGAGAIALPFTAWRAAFAGRTAPNVPDSSPYGELLPADGNGLMLPQGFASRVVARSREAVGGYQWHDSPDGGACFAAAGGGWVYVSNSEVATAGGAGALRFNADASVHSGYRILDGTDRNCAGGSTPWNTWLSCEEVDRGFVYETDPFGVNPAVRRPAMGRFKHEAAAVDPDRRCVYLTEDEPDGNFYRFTPSSWPSLSAGTLEVLIGPRHGDTGPVTWRAVPDPAAAGKATRRQVRGAKDFDGGEGAHYAGGRCWFTTKGDNRVWVYDAAASTLDVLYDAGTPLSGVDNITGSTSGDLFVAEDGGNMEICVITPDGSVGPFLRVVNQSNSELCGPAFSPDGSRLYFSSQRGTIGLGFAGITYEVHGPFRSP